ncbi:MAG TPA: undecaprenyl-diphosphate phosphatase [Spongiibacteraceae bacterium]|nr:undecaprenyl-diphosphate phosphatase [Spongiibacteraceae bacterium]
MSDLWQVVWLGVIEGITEFLPISSTGHLLIAEKLGLGARSDVFNVVIQAGAILAVTAIYWRRLWQLAMDWRDAENRDYVFKLALAFLITGIGGYIITKRGFKLPEEITPVAWALIVGGVWMIAAERLAERKAPSANITWTVAVVVGLAQLVAAIFPGMSRSATTIFAAMLIGANSRAAATEFAFLLGIPTMYAASGKLLFDVVKHGGAADENWEALGIAFVVSTITAFIAVKWLLSYIQTHRFTPFAIYRIAVGGALLLWLPTGA